MKILKLIAVFVAVLSMTFSIPAVVHAAPGAPGITNPTNGELVTFTSYPFPIEFELERYCRQPCAPWQR